MASVRVEAIPTSAHQCLGSEAGIDPLQRLRSVAPIIRPVLRGTERKLATGQYIICGSRSLP